MGAFVSSLPDGISGVMEVALQNLFFTREKEGKCQKNRWIAIAHTANNCAPL